MVLLGFVYGISWECIGIDLKIMIIWIMVL